MADMLLNQIKIDKVGDFSHYICGSGFYTTANNTLFVGFPAEASLAYYPAWNSVTIGTLPETNMAPEKWWLGDYFPFGKAYFPGLC